MAAQNFGHLVSFIFGIANDCLVDVYDVGDYRKIILPMMVIRRFDAVLEPTKEAVLAMKNNLDAAGITEQDEALCGLAKLAGKVGCEALVMTEGESILEKELQITCIQPSETDTYTGNEGSLVLDVSFGAFSMLCTGDVEHVAEEDLTKRVKGKDYDVLKVAHHGSKNSSSEEFLLAIKPEIALISSGKNNRYRHPHPETIERLQKMRCCIYQTKENGAITLRSDGNSLTISLFPL